MRLEHIYSIVESPLQSTPPLLFHHCNPTRPVFTFPSQSLPPLTRSQARRAQQTNPHVRLSTSHSRRAIPRAKELLPDSTMANALDRTISLPVNDVTIQSSLSQMTSLLNESLSLIDNIVRIAEN